MGVKVICGEPPPPEYDGILGYFIADCAVGDVPCGSFNPEVEGGVVFSYSQEYENGVILKNKQKV